MRERDEGFPREPRHGREAAETEMLRTRIEDRLEHRYALLELIGTDGSELCFRARDPRTGDVVVLVVILIESVVLSNASLRLPVWAQRINQVSHPAIPQVVDWGIASGFVYFVVRADMPATLELVMSREVHVPFDGALAILRDVAGALDELHRAGLQHGSLTPSSVLVSGSRKSALLLGAGLADVLKEDPALADSVPTSAAYEAPDLREPFSERDGRADQYALAVIAYELMTARRRAAIDSATGLMTVEPVHIPLGVSLREGLPLHVNTALTRAFSPRANLRYASASEFVAVLSGDVPATPKSPVTEHPAIQRASHSQTAALVSLLALVFVVAMSAVLIFLPDERVQLTQSTKGAVERVKQLPVSLGLSPRTGTSPRAGAPDRGGSTVAGTGGTLTPPGITRSPSETPGLIGAAVSAAVERGSDTISRPMNAAPAHQVVGSGTMVIPMGFVSVTSDLGAGNVYVGGRHAGRAPLVERLRTGNHDISMRSSDFSYDPASATVRVTAGDTVRIHFTARRAGTPP